MNFRNNFIFLVTIWLSLLQANAIQNFQTENSYSDSTESMKSLLDLESTLIDNLEEYVNELKYKLGLAKRALTQFRAEELKMRSDSEYFDNPFNCFAFLRHLQEDWPMWANYMEQLPGTAQIAYAKDLRSELPRIEDLRKASRSIELLVDYYELEPEDLAVGKLSERSEPSTALSTLDCYALAKFNLFRKNYAKAEIWFKISLEKYESDHNPIYKVFDFDESEILKWFAAVLMKRNELDAGLQHLRQAMNVKIDETTDYYMTNAMLQRSCSASFHRPSYLHCRYNDWMTPFLRIAPLKMEELSVNPMPYVVLYYDAIYNSEIEWFMNKSLDFTQALLDEDQLSPERTAQNVHFETEADAVTRTIDRRLTDMTGFSMDLSDELSLINYGIGGHYNLHFDAFDQEVKTMGNRKATVLFYMSNVESGGATILPQINLTVTPERGTAIVWHNLHNDGSQDEGTLHAGCPVIVGNKYVLTKWIYTFSQTFIDPCLANQERSE